MKRTRFIEFVLYFLPGAQREPKLIPVDRFLLNSSKLPCLLPSEALTSATFWANVIGTHSQLQPALHR